MGESDTEQYVEIITDNVMDVLGLEYDGRTKTASSGKEKRVEDYVEGSSSKASSCLCC